ncbi:conserved Plasmodium protein, unknown function [Plasmodium ovale wallikeri]|uniref:Condensin-2 complex subunit H2 C-terminal domain-containing protein n=1 Tax=Plasmodium ovale wallikeri TaxID=864142 RepID=A0A1A8YLM4_PLAOA|nr:conserved Plasmodium protein, unknown function [Plasmodium ovale wallikeri]
MSAPDDLSVLIQSLQKCSNTSECINFDLVSSIQEFLNCLDKNVFEDIERGNNEEEKEKEVINSFTSAAIFVENCVKIFGLKIEHLHNLAHNTLCNIHRENKNHNHSGNRSSNHSGNHNGSHSGNHSGSHSGSHSGNRKHLMFPDEEEYLFVCDIKTLKYSTNENDNTEDDLLVKTIPLPTFLFTENIKKKENPEDEKDRIYDVDVITYGENVTDEVGTTNGVDTMLNVGVPNGMITTDEDRSLSRGDEFQIMDANSIISLNFDKMFLENDGMLLQDINDYNVFINDQSDFTIKNKNSTILFEKYDFFSREATYVSSDSLCEYIGEKNSIEDTYKIYHFNDIICGKICSDTLLFKTYFSDYDFALGILKNKKYILKKFKEQKKYFFMLDENTHMNNEKILTWSEKNDIKRKLPNYYILNCHNIKNSQDFFRYMQPSKILDIIKRNDKNKNTFNEHDKRVDETIGRNEGDENYGVTSSGEKNFFNFSPDQRLFHQIKIPDLYVQKLGLNFSYYHLEPLLYNLIKDLKKKKNVEKFFSIDLYDEKANYDFDILKDEEYQEEKNDESAPIEETLTFDNFLDAKSINGDIQDLPLEVLNKKDSVDAFFLSFDEDAHDRLNKWNLFLEEKLELLRKQPRYDVDHYKKSIINYTINSGDRISFTNLIRNKEQYQICRNFLTTLMLINTDILSISEINSHDTSNDVSNYQINIKRENVEEYLNTSNRFKNTKFVIKDKKRKNEAKQASTAPQRKMQKMASKK